MSRNEDPEVDRLEHDLRQRRPKTRGPRKMAEVLSGLLARRGYAQQLSRNQFTDAWREAVGGGLAAGTCAGAVKRGVLEVIVRDSATLQELTFQKKRLLQQLARLVPEPPIRDLRFRVGEIPREES
ncbi:MAG: DUF721 domain-containing protein [Pirellulaceae bacterium]|nr:DUF721 domain-containing protein [Pirellulaceae bacterium]